MIQKEHILEWIDDYPARLLRGLKAFPPQVRVADRHVEYFNDVVGQDDEANREWMENSEGQWIFGARDRGKDLRIAIEHAEACVEAMSDEPGAWQQNKTLLPDNVLKIMRDPGFTEKIASWPTGELMDGHDTRRIGRLTALFRKFERGDRERYLAPETWKEQDVITATHWYKAYMLELLIKQRDVLSRWTPETCVPEFDLLRAAGNPGHWNNLPTSQQRGGKGERESRRSQAERLTTTGLKSSSRLGDWRTAHP